MAGMALLDIFDLEPLLFGEELGFRGAARTARRCGPAGFCDGPPSTDGCPVSGRCVADELGQTVLVLAELGHEMPVPLAFGGVLPAKFRQFGLLSFETGLEDIPPAVQIVELGLQSCLFEPQFIPLGDKAVDLVAAKTAQSLEALGPAEFSTYSRR